MARGTPHLWGTAALRVALAAVSILTMAACGRFGQSNSASVQPFASPTVVATASASAAARIMAHGLDEIEDPQGVALAYIVTQTHTDANDWELLRAATTDIGPYPDAAWSGKFLDAATMDEACVIVLPGDQVFDCQATLDLQNQAESQLAVTAQELYDDQIAPIPGMVAAAAFVTTTYAIYAESLPDTAGIQGTPGPYDRVIVIEAEGIFPATHSCGFIMTACFDTAIQLTYDVATGQTINLGYSYDPWSPDLPSPEPSVSERFGDLSRWGTPIRLSVDAES